MQAMAEAPDPDMALNNLERLASQVERAALFRLLEAHPGALHFWRSSAAPASSSPTR